MTEVMWVRSHVERLLCEIQETCHVAVDRDGDFPLAFDTSAGWVAVLEEPSVMVRVVAHAVYGVRSSAKLLRELNELNQRATSSSICLVDDIVVVQQTVSPIGITRPVLAQAINSVGCIADDVGPLLAAMFDGATPIEPEPGTGTDDRLDEEAS